MSQDGAVVVLGGTGFIGQELVRQLRDRGKPVRVVSTRAARNLPLEDPGVEWLSADTRDRVAISAALSGASVVHHLAREPDDDFETGVRAVAEACISAGVRRLIYASSSDALYLGSRGVIRESDGVDPRPDLRNSYSRSKARSERLLLDYHKNLALPVVILRPSIVVGRGGRLAHGALGHWLAPTCCIGWGTGRNPLPFVLVRDVADAHIRAMDVAEIEGSAFNLVGDVLLSGREYIEIVAERSMRNFRFHPRSAALHFADAKAKQVLKRLQGQPAHAASYRNAKSRAMLTRIDNMRAKSVLGWRPVKDLEAFIREGVDINIEPVPDGDLRRSGQAGI